MPCFPRVLGSVSGLQVTLPTLLVCAVTFYSHLVAGMPVPSPSTTFWGRPDSNVTDSGEISAAARLREQYNFPKEVLAILSLIGGDIVRKACAQEAGAARITPVAFSLDG